MSDRDKVIEALEICAAGTNSCIKCPMKDKCHGVSNAAMVAAIKLLKEQEEVVRCVDCKHYMTIHCNCGGCFISDDWYCADGERR